MLQFRSITFSHGPRPTTLTHSIPTSALATYTYHYDNASRVDGSTALAGEANRSYAYDNSNQLTTVTNSSTSAVLESYTYDLNGNRTSANGVTYGAPGAGNRLLNDGNYTYTYDNEGNMQTRSKSGELTTFTWDYRNRLSEVVQTVGTVVTDDVFTYDVKDRRIGKSVNAGMTQWTVYDGGNSYADFSGITLTYRYLEGLALDSLFARTDANAGSTAWYLTDRLSSVRQMANASGSVADTMTYDSHGKVTESSPSNGDRFKYTAREWDSELGEYFYRARYYGPAIGRFLEEDPLGFRARDANLYRYVHNSPPNSTDPTGRKPIAYTGGTCEEELTKCREAAGKVREMCMDQDGDPVICEQIYKFALGVCEEMYWNCTHENNQQPSPQPTQKGPCWEAIPVGIAAGAKVCWDAVKVVGCMADKAATRVCPLFYFDLRPRDILRRPIDDAI